MKRGFSRIEIISEGPAPCRQAKDGYDVAGEDSPSNEVVAFGLGCLTKLFGYELILFKARDSLLLFALLNASDNGGAPHQTFKRDGCFLGLHTPESFCFSVVALLQRQPFIKIGERLEGKCGQNETPELP